MCFHKDTNLAKPAALSPELGRPRGRQPRASEERAGSCPDERAASRAEHWFQRTDPQAPRGAGRTLCSHPAPHPPAPARPWGAEGAPAHTADMPRGGHGTSAGREGTWLPGQTPRGKRPSGEMPWARVNCRGPVSAGVQDGASRCVPHRGVRRRSQGLGAGQLARQAD